MRPGSAQSRRLRSSRCARPRSKSSGSPEPLRRPRQAGAAPSRPAQRVTRAIPAEPCRAMHVAHARQGLAGKRRVPHYACRPGPASARSGQPICITHHSSDSREAARHQACPTCVLHRGPAARRRMVRYACEPRPPGTTRSRAPRQPSAPFPRCPLLVDPGTPTAPRTPAPRASAPVGRAAPAHHATPGSGRGCSPPLPAAARAWTCEPPRTCAPVSTHSGGQSHLGRNFVPPRAYYG